MDTVAVVGGSNGGYAAAADLADRGFEVRWYVRTADNHGAVLADDRVTLRVADSYVGRRTPGTSRQVAVERVTTDLGRALAGADIVLVPLPTTAQGPVTEALAPNVEAGQTVVFCPGNAGSVPFRRAVEERPDPPADVVVAETPTLPYVTRRSGPAEVTINLDAVRLPVGAFPGRETDRAIDALSTCYDAAMAAEDALDAALNNSNVGVNATPTVLNAGAIDCEELAFNVHRHGVGERTLRAVVAVDDERVQIRERLGYGPPHFTQDEYWEPGPATGEHFYGANAREALTAADTFSEDPPSLDDRYVHEDVRVAAVLQGSAAGVAGVETPALDALLHLASVLMGEPYPETGRTLGRLGIDADDPESLADALDRGFDR